VVVLPLAVAVGETVPQGGAEHDTIQVTPFAAESLATVAVSWSVAPGCTVAALGDSVMVTGSSLSPVPPQPAMAIVKAMQASKRAENVERSTTPPYGQPGWQEPSASYPSVTNRSDSWSYFSIQTYVPQGYGHRKFRYGIKPLRYYSRALSDETAPIASAVYWGDVKLLV
jgi:hypothetical protein